MAIESKYAQNIRKLAILKVLEKIKDDNPIKIQKLIAVCEFEMGYREANIKSMLKVLLDVNKIEMNEDTITFVSD